MTADNGVGDRGGEHMHNMCTNVRKMDTDFQVYICKEDGCELLGRKNGNGLERIR